MTIHRVVRKRHLERFFPRIRYVGGGEFFGGIGRHHSLSQEDRGNLKITWQGDSLT